MVCGGNINEQIHSIASSTVQGWEIVQGNRPRGLLGSFTRVGTAWLVPKILDRVHSDTLMVAQECEWLNLAACFD
jgi:hypothetical protein